MSTNSETAAAGQINTDRLEIIVSEDKMQAWIAFRGAAVGDYEPPTSDDVLAALENAKIAVTDLVRTRVEAYVKLFEPPDFPDDPQEPAADDSEQTAGQDASTDTQDPPAADAPGPPEIPEKFLIAQGAPPTESSDAVFKWHDDFDRHLEDWQGDATINYYTLNAIITVEADVTIGTYTPAQRGKAGIDVRGGDVSPRKPVELEVGKGLRISNDSPAQLISDTAGRVVNKNQRIYLDEVLEIKGDVDFSAGNVDSAIDVQVNGTVLDNFVVKTKKSLTVGGAIEAAEINVAENLIVRGGIIGRGRGRVTVAGEMTAKFCEEADLTCQGDVKILKQIVNSRCRTQGRLIAEHGALIGGYVHAVGGADLRTLGSSAYVKTEIAVGPPPEILARIHAIGEEIGASEKAVEQLRSTLAPLMANMKRLSSGQREKATELMCKADEIEMSVDDLREERKKLVTGAGNAESANVVVNKLIYTGVSVAIGPRVTHFKKDFKGPLRIELKKVDNVTEMVAVHPSTKSMIVLPSEAVVLPKKEKKPAKDDGPDEKPQQ